MCRNRCRDRENNVSGVQEIALRGPGCISGTGQCEGVLGTGGRRRCEELCNEIFGDRGRRCCSNVLGTGEEQRCGQVFGTGGGFMCNDVAGTGGRRNRCKDSWWDLKTPTTVPR